MHPPIKSLLIQVYTIYIYTRCTDIIGRKFFYDVLGHAIEIDNSVRQGRVSPCLCCTLSICCLFAFSMCLSDVTLCTLAPYTPFHAHLFTNNSTKTNKKNNNNVVYGHTLFVLIASKRFTTKHHESGLRGLNELCEKSRGHHFVLPKRKTRLNYAGNWEM